jgi:hypothetical protein
MKHILWVSALVLGIVAGLLLAQLPGISVQKSIDLDGLATLFVGLLLFFGFNVIYQKQFAASRAEKEILIKLATDALSSAEDLDHIFCKCHHKDPLPESSVEEILGGVQRFNNSIHTLERGLKKCGVSESKVGMPSMQNLREEYRVVLTESPFPKRYDPGAIRLQQRHQLAVREAFVDLILDLNRL